MLGSLLTSKMKLVSFAESSLDLEAQIAVQSKGFLLTFVLAGTEPESISIPINTTKPSRKHELWKDTCFECFFGVVGSTQYFEFNGSPSGDWALYSFDEYRTGMKDVKMTEPPVLEKFEKTATGIRVEWRIPYFTPAILMSASLAAILKFSAPASGFSYWALKHAGEKPDFHLRDSFIHRLV